jgi:hypothetical protein
LPRYFRRGIGTKVFRSLIFVLAYHYLVLGQINEAIKELESVVKLLPGSQLSEELLAALKEESRRPSPR